MVRQKKIVGQLQMLSKELENKKLSAERVNEIKEISMGIADYLDQEIGVPFLSGMIAEVYREDTLYLKRRVKKAIGLLIEYSLGTCEE